jgi:hypothetical protein
LKGITTEPAKISFRPTEAQLQRGVPYGILVENVPGDPGVICKLGVDKPTALWRFTAKPDFVVSDLQDNEQLRIRRVGWSLAAFKISREGIDLGVIRMTSVLRNRYQIRFMNGSEWQIRMPLFSIFFGGVSNIGQRIWIRMGPTKTRWTVLFDPETEAAPLIGAIAFIHRRWWRC